MFDVGYVKRWYTLLQVYYVHFVARKKTPSLIRFRISFNSSNEIHDDWSPSSRDGTTTKSYDLQNFTVFKEPTGIFKTLQYLLMYI